MEVVTVSSPGFTHGRKDLGIMLSHVSIVLLNIPAWCSVTCCKVGCADKKGPAVWAWGAGKMDSPSILLCSVRSKVEQWVWGLLAACPQAGQVEHF